MRRLTLLLTSLLLLAADVPRTPTIDTLPVPGPDALAEVARDVVAVAVAIDPSLAAGNGLFDDALRVPSWSPKSVKKLVKRADRALVDLRALPWAELTIDEQIDARWLYAVAETAKHQLLVERLYARRPAQWLEPVANDLINLGSYAPDRPELQDQVFEQIPAMIAEMRQVVTEPTARDIETAITLADALAEMAAARNDTAASSALALYAEDLAKMAPNHDFAVIGPDAYAWRVAHTQLLPWTADELLARAEAELAVVDARLAGLPPRSADVPPTDAQLALAKDLDRDRLLGLYDAIELAHRASTLAGGWVSIPEAVGPVRARETPDAMVPLTGDGGSMNPPPTYADWNIGYWNVEHFNPEWTLDERAGMITRAQGFLDNGMGPYSAHEGFPGHHLQLSIARLHADPIRSILPDSVLNEGWGLYSEETHWQHGGLGAGADAERSMLNAYRGRIRRVVYDVNVETGRWTLQQAADWKHGQAGGVIDEDILRAINWPTQLTGYFAGKVQIVALREEVRAKEGAAFDERRFHDALLAEGSIPVALIRCKMLGLPVPSLPAE